eukprot:GILK01002738.1.p1 GENE.GILK01002738.1~~GILK01002738.1.p1  ORF type:complete len:410 (-),score=43.25 GILK01002738.1:41-1207(-)
MSDTWVLGAVSYTCGSLMINLGTNLMKYWHSKTQKKAQEKQKFEAQRHSKLNFWNAGAALFAIGNVFNFIGLGMAPQTVLSSLGSIQFVSNVVFVAIVFKVPITLRIIGATMTIICGNVAILFSSTNENTESRSITDLQSLYAREEYIIYISTVLGFALCLDIAYRFMEKWAKRHGFPHNLDSTLSLSKVRWLGLCYATSSGIIGTQSVLLSKSASELLHTSVTGDSQFRDWFTYLVLVLWVASMVFWLNRLNSALKKFDALFIIPTLQVVWTLFSVIAGGVYFDEFSSLGSADVFLFVVGIVLIIAGVVLLSTANAKDQKYLSLHDSASEDEHEETDHEVSDDVTVITVIPADHAIQDGAVSRASKADDVHSSILVAAEAEPESELS